MKNKKKIMVFSLGGSLIIPEHINPSFLPKFKETLKRFYSKYKFVIVAGGGEIARDYISILKKAGKSKIVQSRAGILATRENAKILIKLFGKESNSELALNMKEVKSNLNKNPVVICAALRYSPESTSDVNATNLAKYLKCEFINITNVPGLFTKDPKKNKSAKFISSISWKDFENLAKKLKYKPGQHFVLDQKASSIIRKYKIPSYIIGSDLKNLERILNKEPFIGTTIYG